MIKSEIIWKMWTIYCITNLCFRMAFLVLFYELREKWKAFNNFIVFFLSIYHKEYEYFKLSVSKITICVWFVHHAQNNNIFIYGKDREKGIASFHKNRLCAIRGCLSKRLLLLLPLFSFFLLPWKRFKNYDKWSVSILTVWSGINFFIGKKKIQNKQNNKISVFFFIEIECWIKYYFDSIFVLLCVLAALSTPFDWRFHERYTIIDLVLIQLR